MFVSLVPMSPLSLGIPFWCLCRWYRCHLCRWGFPSDVCVAGGVVTFAVGDSPLVIVLLVALSPWLLVVSSSSVSWLASPTATHGWLHPPPRIACHTHRHSWLATPTATHGLLHPPPLMAGFTHRHAWLASPTATHGWLHPPPLLADILLQSVHVCCELT